MSTVEIDCLDDWLLGEFVSNKGHSFTLFLLFVSNAWSDTCMTCMFQEYLYDTSFGFFYLLALPVADQFLLSPDETEELVDVY